MIILITIIAVIFYCFCYWYGKKQQFNDLFKSKK